MFVCQLEARIIGLGVKFFSMYKITILVCFFTNLFVAQGLVNNGASIVITNGANVYIDGDANGKFTNQNGGLVKNASVGGNILLEGNWINNATNVVFQNDGAKVHFKGAAQTIGGSNSTTFYTLKLLGSGTKTLAVNTKVGGISIKTGVLELGTRPLNLNSNTLTISNPLGSAITNSTGYIISETNSAVNPSIVKWEMGTNTGAHVYPFGVTGTLIPFTFNKTTSNASDVSVSTRATSSSSNTPWSGVSSVAAVSNMASAVLNLADASEESVIDRWWDIHTSAATTGDLIFSYRGVENTTTTDPTASFSAQHWNGNSWDPQVGSGIGVTSGVGTVSVSGASSFSPWVLSTTSSGPLPVSLLDFKVNCNSESKAILFWSTESESNSADFIIERSRDLITWEYVESIQAAGNSSSYLAYTITDFNALSGVSYYRLNQRDFNGAEKYYGPISLNCNSEEQITIFPNPSAGFFTVQVTSNSLFNPSKIELFNLEGKLIAYRDIQIIEGNNQFIFNEHLAEGIYILRVSDSENTIRNVKLQLKN